MEIEANDQTQILKICDDPEIFKDGAAMFVLEFDEVWPDMDGVVSFQDSEGVRWITYKVYETLKGEEYRSYAVVAFPAPRP